ncbi:MAG TPA: cytochrome c [Candidatus Angelobacter sp.]
MKIKFVFPTVFLTAALLLSLTALASPAGKDAPKDTVAGTVATPTVSAAQDEMNRVEGEKRFRSNCGRCHAAPPKFPPRMMATIVRHMRVRATITDQDMHYILRYMTE